MKFLRRKQNEAKAVETPPSKSSSDKYIKDQLHDGAQYNIQASDTVTVYTDVLNTSDLSNSFSMSTIGTSPTSMSAFTSSPSPAHKRPLNGKNTAKRSWRRNFGKRGKITTNSSMTSLDRRIIETEEKVQAQIRQLTSGSFDDDDDDNNEECGEGNNRTRARGSDNYHEHNGEKSKMRLMTTSGVLLFDGLGESKINIIYIFSR